MMKYQHFLPHLHNKAHIYRHGHCLYDKMTRIFWKVPLVLVLPHCIGLNLSKYSSDQQFLCESHDRTLKAYIHSQGADDGAYFKILVRQFRVQIYP